MTRTRTSRATGNSPPWSWTDCALLSLPCSQSSPRSLCCCPHHTSWCRSGPPACGCACDTFCDTANTLLSCDVRYGAGAESRRRRSCRRRRDARAAPNSVSYHTTAIKCARPRHCLSHYPPSLFLRFCLPRLQRSLAQEQCPSALLPYPPILR